MSVSIAQYTSDSTWSYGTSGTLLGQTFTVATGYTKVADLRIKLLRVGTVSGNVTVSLYATSGDLPTGSALASATIAASSVSTSSSGTYYTFDIADTTVTSGGKYAIVLAHNGTSSSKYIGWRNDGSTAGYSGGRGCFKYATGSWTGYATAKDFSFYVYGYGVPASMGATTTSDIASTSFTAASSAGDDMGATISARGFVYSSSTATPTLSDSVKTSDSGEGSFNASITGLSPGVTYYVRSYATNAAGTSYGAVKTQATTVVVPTVTTQACSSVGPTTVTGNGTVTATGGATVTRRGFCYIQASSGDPTTSDSTTYDDGTFGTGAFSKEISSLTGGTDYQVRAYAVNSEGTSYGTTVSVTTAAVDAPTVTTATTTSLTQDTAVAGGNVTDQGDTAVTDRGIYWGTTEETQGTQIQVGTGLGVFVATISSLDADTDYYYKAYATNTAGTAYGDILHFKTAKDTPTLEVVYALPPFKV